MKNTDTGLTLVNEETGEITKSTSEAEAVSRVQSSIVIAKRFPRDENQAFQSLMLACERPSFADTVVYAFPRGGRTIPGPSVSIAREAARVWGNIHYGLKVITDNEEIRTIRGWAWDVESNAYVEAEDTFKKVVQRRQYDQGGAHVGTADEVASERDLRELTNRRGAILVRNSLLQLIPKDLIEDAIRAAKKTLSSRATENPAEYRKKLITAFGSISISVADIEAFLDDKIDRVSGEKLTELRGIYKAITEGGQKWTDFVKKESKGDVSVDDLSDATDRDVDTKKEDASAINVARLKKRTGKVNIDQQRHLQKLAVIKEMNAADFSEMLGRYGAEDLTDLAAKEFEAVQTELEELVKSSEVDSISPEQGQLP